MKADDEALLQHIASLLERPAYRDHPLREALESLYRRHLDQRDRLARLISIADGFQQSAQEDLHSTRDQLERQLRRQHKLSRIADRYQALLRERNQVLRVASTRDPLTGLANRRMLDEHLERAAAFAERRRRPFTLAMLDVDHFKRINDRHGHEAGDRVLVRIADTLREALRATDHCGRWGGEEFLLLLPDTGLEQAERIVMRLLQRLREQEIHLDGEGLRLTASAGLAEYRRGEGYQATLGRADRALLQAKQAGRDRSRIGA